MLNSFRSSSIVFALAITVLELSDKADVISENLPEAVIAGAISIGSSAVIEQLKNRKAIKFPWDYLLLVFCSVCVLIAVK